MATTTVTLAPVAARSAGLIKSGQHALPQGHYQEIKVSLTNAGGLDFTNDTGFVDGDVIHGMVDISTDGGATWDTLLDAEWHGGAPSGRTGGYSVSVIGIDIPANTVYRAGALISPGVQGGTITFGAQGSVTT